MKEELFHQFLRPRAVAPKWTLLVKNAGGAPGKLTTLWSKNPNPPQVSPRP